MRVCLYGVTSSERREREKKNGNTWLQQTWTFISKWTWVPVHVCVCVCAEVTKTKSEIRFKSTKQWNESYGKRERKKNGPNVILSHQQMNLLSVCIHECETSNRMISVWLFRLAIFVGCFGAWSCDDMVYNEYALAKQRQTKNCLPFLHIKGKTVAFRGLPFLPPITSYIWIMWLFVLRFFFHDHYSYFGETWHTHTHISSVTWVKIYWFFIIPSTRRLICADVLQEGEQEKKHHLINIWDDFESVKLSNTQIISLYFNTVRISLFIFIKHSHICVCDVFFSFHLYSVFAHVFAVLLYMTLFFHVANKFSA